MEKFFNDLLFEEGAAYTLWGSKPLTEIVLYHYSPEEFKKLNAALSQEELETGHINDRYDLPANWTRWEEMAKNLPIHRYLLFRSHFDKNGKFSFVYFVDVLNTAIVIQKNYSLFKSAVGFDFHPLEVVLEMPQRDSKFWSSLRKAKSRPLLWGILFGYGETNASAYYWANFQSTEAGKKFLASLNPSDSNPPLCGKVKITQSNFTIPSFISYETSDPEIAKYKKEQERIQKIYRGKDFLETTLQRLTSSE